MKKIFSARARTPAPLLRSAGFKGGTPNQAPRRALVGLCAALMLSFPTPALAGAIAAWGNNSKGQVSRAPTGTGFTAIAGGGSHGYALRANGSIAAWGYDGNGQVSDTPTGTGFTAIAAGAGQGYALRADGSIAAWGYDGEGQVSGTPTGTGFTAIAGGSYSAWALRADGSIAAWGDNSHGQVSDTPTGTGFTAIAGGPYNGWALREDGSIAAWGNDDGGQVSATPTGTGFTAIARGWYHGYALRADGSIAAWGYDGSGQVSGAPTGTGFTAIAGGYFQGYALRADGSIAAWGYDGNGQVSGTPTGTGFTAIAGGAYHGYALAAAVADPCPWFPLANALDLCQEWASGGARPWFGQTVIKHDGVDAARSGLIGHGKNTWLQTQIVGPGTVYFWWKVSSEPKDKLRLVIDSVTKAEVSGERPWRARSFYIPEGVHTLRWIYRKDSNLAGGRDAAWVDQVRFIPATSALAR